MSANDRIDCLYSRDFLRERAVVEMISAAPHPDEWINLLWHHNRTFFLYHLKCKKIDALKLDAYHCARIDEYLVRNYGSTINQGINHVTFALLSDNKDLIARYAVLSHEDTTKMVESGKSTLPYCLQQIMQEDWDKVVWSLEIMKTKSLKLGEVLQSDLSFFDALLEKDLDKMIIAVEKILEQHAKRINNSGFAGKYISIPALTYSKLAWLKGFEIDINHPLVPKQLLPYQPIESYEDKYNFLTV